MSSFCVRRAWNIQSARTLFWFVMWMEAEGLSQVFAESFGLLSPPCGSVASSRSMAAADDPTPDPWGKPEGNKGEEINKGCGQLRKDSKLENLYNFYNQTSEKCIYLNVGLTQTKEENFALLLFWTELCAAPPLALHMKRLWSMSSMITRSCSTNISMSKN